VKVIRKFEVRLYVELTLVALAEGKVNIDQLCAVINYCSSS